MPYEFEEGAGLAQQQGPDEWSHIQPIPVRVMFNETEVLAPAFSSWTSFVIQPFGSGQAVRPTRICPHRYHREKAKFLVTFAAASTSKLYLARTEDYLSSLSVANAFLVTLGQNIPEYEGQQPVYAIVVGPDPITVSVLDQGHGEVQ
jgi:hypothetical protein